MSLPASRSALAWSNSRSTARGSPNKFPSCLDKRGGARLVSLHAHAGWAGVHDMTCVHDMTRVHDMTCVHDMTRVHDMTYVHDMTCVHDMTRVHDMTCVHDMT